VHSVIAVAEDGHPPVTPTTQCGDSSPLCDDALRRMPKPEQCSSTRLCLRRLVRRSLGEGGGFGRQALSRNAGLRLLATERRGRKVPPLRIERVGSPNAPVRSPRRSWVLLPINGSRTASPPTPCTSSARIGRTSTQCSRHWPVLGLTRMRGRGTSEPKPPPKPEVVFAQTLSARDAPPAARGNSPFPADEIECRDRRRFDR